MGPFLIHFKFIFVQFLWPWQVNLSPFQNHKSKLKHFWSILTLPIFGDFFWEAQQFFLGRGWNDWQAMHPEDLCNLKEDFIIWMIIGHLKNAVGGPLLGEFMMPMQFWNFFFGKFWEEKGGKLAAAVRRPRTKRQWPGETSWSLSWLLRPNGPATYYTELERRSCRKR